jgi:hypothetical protein
MLKQCSKCKKIKPIGEFHKHKGGKYGVESFCKECRKAYYRNNTEKYKEHQKKYYKKNKEKYYQYSKNWLENNREKANKQRREWYKNNIEHCREHSKERSKRYHINNPKKTKEYQRQYDKQYYINNREKIKERRRRYIKNNPEIVKEQWRKRREKRKLNIVLHLSDRMRNQILRSLRGNKNGNHWEDLVDYTLKDLMIHLESLFKDGMSWDNYGKWHIDHIKPVDSFNFTSYKDKEFKKCYALKNLQPLWAFDNISKGNKII